MVNGGVIHEGTYAARHHHKGNPSASEWKPVERDIRLAEETGARYHVCHISTKESVALVRHAKAQGLPVSGETCPHYLTMTDEDLQEEGRFRMNPPIRSGADREALREAIADGTLLCITTDHAPHSEEEKSRGLDQSLNGIVGLETSFPVLYTNLVLTGLLSLERLVEAMSVAPARGLRISEVREAKETAGFGTEIAVGQPADFAVWDLDASWTIDPRQFHSKGASTPFQGWTVRGLCQSTVISGEEVYHAHGWKPRERRLKKENENE